MENYLFLHFGLRPQNIQENGFCIDVDLCFLIQSGSRMQHNEEQTDEVQTMHVEEQWFLAWPMKFLASCKN